MAFDLTPRWKPLRFGVAPGMPLFDPVIVQERGLLVAGGPDALAVFAIGDRQYEWFTIPKKAWITGFAVSASSLYVQDGPVLLSYDLTVGKPFAALNLVTGVRWWIEDSPEPPDSIYSLSGSDAVLHRELIAAREAQGASALLSAPDAVGRAAALRTAQLNARGVDFSPPVVRKYQVEGRRGGQVFSLRMDGLVISIDTGLEEPLVFAAEAPLRPELVMVEIPLPDGRVDCQLYYVTAAGGINALDANGDVALLPSWAGAGAPVPERVLPLRYVDGMLFGGGLFGSALFVKSLNPAKPPVFQMDGPAEGWRSYDVSPAEKLVLVSDGMRTREEGMKSRLACYDPAARSRNRWGGERVSATPVWNMFWPGTGIDALFPSSKLILETGRASPNNAQDWVDLRVVLANTVDSVDMSLTSDYPPPTTELETGRLERGTQTVASSITWMPCRPVMSRHTLYCVARFLDPATKEWAHAVVAYSFAARLASLLDKAAKRVDQLKLLARPLELKVMRIERWTEPPNRHDVKSRGPNPMQQSQIDFVLEPGGWQTVRTDSNGIARFDSSKRGAKVTIDPKYMRDVQSITTATLTAGEIPVMLISTMRNLGT